MRTKIKEIICIHIILLLIIILADCLHIRICLFYFIFHIPCVGCGLSRGFIYLFKGDIKTSIAYNFLSIILLTLYIIIFIWYIFDIINKKETLTNFLNRYKKCLIIISICITVIAWFVNIKNPLLY